MNAKARIVARLAARYPEHIDPGARIRRVRRPLGLNLEVQLYELRLRRGGRWACRVDVQGDTLADLEARAELAISQAREALRIG